MILRPSSSTVKQPAIEHNAQHVYIRFDYQQTTIPATEEEPEYTLWNYQEYYMTDNEYNSILSGTYSGEWSDALRSIERGALYDEADKMISKYSTDVPDNEKRTAWIQYKHEVRATQDAQGYPQTVAYPERPE